MGILTKCGNIIQRKRWIFVSFFMLLCIVFYSSLHIVTNRKSVVIKIEPDEDFHKSIIVNRNNTMKKVYIPTTENPVDKSDEFRKNHFMTISGQGRLGNRMFQFAALLGICHKHGYTPYLTPRHSLNSVFEISQKRDIKMSNSRSVGERGAGVYDSNLEKLSHDKNYTLGGYYQSWRYFDFISDYVKSSFKFKRSFLSKVHDFVTINKLVNRTLVGVHVRRGDMASHSEMRRGYNVATKIFFVKAIEYFKSHFHDPVFVVVGDDLNWCRSNIKGDGIKYVATGSPGGDLAMIANCNHAIVSSGTYGWWGAYLTGGTVIYYGNYPSRGSWLRKQYNTTDYYPPNWIAME